MKPVKYLDADRNLARFSLLGTLSMAMPIGEMSTWVLTGEAAIIGAILVNVEKVSQSLFGGNLKWWISFLVLSMLLGVVAKQIGVAIKTAVSAIESIYSALETEEGKKIQDNLTWSPEELAEEISSAYFWPMNKLIKKSFFGGAEDQLFGEKRLIKMLCIEMYLTNSQGVLGAIGLIILALGIK